MPHLVDSYKDKETIRLKLNMFCKGKFTDEEIERAERLDIIGSSFNDPGKDWCEYRLIFSETESATVMVVGY